MYSWGIASVVLLTSLASVAALPAVFLAYNVGERQSQPATLLDCVANSDGPSSSYTCRPVREGTPNTAPVEELEGEAPFQSQPEEIVQGHSSSSRDAGHVNTLRTTCAPHQIYVPELDICEEVVHHLRPPVMSDPRLARWYSWRNKLLRMANNPTSTARYSINNH